MIPDWEQRCAKRTVTSVISLLILLLLAGILLAYYCEWGPRPLRQRSCGTPSLLWGYITSVSLPSFLRLRPRPGVRRRELRVGVRVVRRRAALPRGPGRGPLRYDYWPSSRCTFPLLLLLFLSCSVRLRGSGFELQVYASGWRSVCSRGWSARQGQASCLELGYSRSADSPRPS